LMFTLQQVYRFDVTLSPYRHSLLAPFLLIHFVVALTLSLYTLAYT
jgi:hypothetical protein